MKKITITAYLFEELGEQQKYKAGWNYLHSKLITRKTKEQIAEFYPEIISKGLYYTFGGHCLADVML